MSPALISPATGTRVEGTNTPSCSDSSRAWRRLTLAGSPAGWAARMTYGRVISPGQTGSEVMPHR